MTKGKTDYKHIVLISGCFGVIVYAVFLAHCIVVRLAQKLRTGHSSIVLQLRENFGNRPSALNRFARAHFCIRVNRLSGAYKLTEGSVTAE